MQVSSSHPTVQAHTASPRRMYQPPSMSPSVPSDLSLPCIDGPFSMMPACTAGVHDVEDVEQAFFYGPGLLDFSIFDSLTQATNSRANHDNDQSPSTLDINHDLQSSFISQERQYGDVAEDSLAAPADTSTDALLNPQFDQFATNYTLGPTPSKTVFGMDSCNPRPNMFTGNLPIQDAQWPYGQGSNTIPNDPSLDLGRSRADNAVHTLRDRAQPRVTKSARPRTSSVFAPSHTIIGLILSDEDFRNDHYRCPIKSCAGLTFSRPAELKRHHRTQHTEPHFYCPVAGCQRSRGGYKGAFPRKDKLKDHVQRVHSTRAAQSLG
ncbi:hypothetical protein BDV96DRAFT_205778 [Lophiotrema nucula]|uniref:C2H2-type domain-containing protein n=1 Tax=Lophiotrema nucula TaxID=690887 RepID=A0A6A5ZPN2_9PLEO|nr:hypothetical protein BDV96DRAFT_205778 [Lophiotrema nucula]